MTTYAKSIDQTEASANGSRFSVTVGSGGVSAGQTVKWDGVSSNTVVACSGISDLCIGIARDTVAATGVVTVLGRNCRVKTNATLTIGARVEPSASGYTQTYTSGTIIGTVITAATTASIIRLNPPY